MDILKNLRISNHYKYLLYIFGILLILSLSIEIKIISNLKLMILSAVSILYGIICWLYDENMRNLTDNINLAWQFELSKHRTVEEMARDLAEDRDPHKDFKEKYNPIKLAKKYTTTRSIVFIIYLMISLLIIIYIK